MAKKDSSLGPFHLSVANPPASISALTCTNTLTYYRIRTLPICNVFIVQAPEAGFLNKSSCLARTLGVTKFINMRDIIWGTLYCAT
jgi:hypothetical protein